MILFCVVLYLLFAGFNSRDSIALSIVFLTGILLQALPMDATSSSETPQDTVYEEIESFFDSAPPLKDGADISRKLNEFIARDSQSTGKFVSESCFPLASLLLLFYAICLLWRLLN